MGLMPASHASGPSAGARHPEDWRGLVALGPMVDRYSYRALTHFPQMPAAIVCGPVHSWTLPPQSCCVDVCRQASRGRFPQDIRLSRTTKVRRVWTCGR
jgi:hypothetical protein